LERSFDAPCYDSVNQQYLPATIDFYSSTLDNQISDEEYNKFMDEYFPNVNNYQWSEK
jgi:hypothetical protein